MRNRPIIALSVVALAALSLVGCSSQPKADATPTSTAAPDLCTAQVASGTSSDAVKVTGEVGKEAKVSFDTPLEITDLQSTVVKKGDGDKISSGDFIQFALTEFNAESGDKNGAIGQTEGSLLPQQVSATSTLGQVLGCASVGSRVVATMPGDEDYPATVDVLDVLKVVPTAAWGTAQEPKAGFPTVKLASDGTPSVTLPSGDMPTKFAKETLKKGDGVKVAEGDAVLVQYYGVSWNSKKTFDKSWGSTPFTVQQVGTGVVDGFSKAIEGETVGSQVVAVLPPSSAYGEGEINDDDLTGQTLVFVIDIIGVQKAS
ncbi:FKBP-type peptidyl-prolyl cis-trans isomerase [Microbacterium protaetiae]|uniref:Peptidyl-prolyl cis-trans isomerase n=1 Tax=Microbacterium protaetiae TaxID=2509458 RepID=A0A4P6E9S1_9MICO|nr:FKBP-type peptidyl-prolyl cis-trans isomerase [Microbacterium protaetiae]QAY58684.1 FKBP-type peptidyl-prolyl cis-trans isomerase [Microbacterium protaetiae]